MNLFNSKALLTFVVSALPIAGLAQDFAMSRLPEIISGLVNPDLPNPKMRSRLLAKTAPDECFTAIGEPITTPDKKGRCAQGIPKRNQSYVWGLAQYKDKLWFGTAPNVLCSVMSALSSNAALTIDLGSFVCEGSQSASGTGDWRKPRILRWDITSKSLKDRTPADTPGVFGYRAGGAHNGIAFLAGPTNVEASGGVVMVAFDAKTDAYLGSHTFQEYSDIRKYIVFKGILYAAVKNAQGGGSILRWRGTPSDLWNFEVVGHIDSDGANI